MRIAELPPCKREQIPGDIGTGRPCGLEMDDRIHHLGLLGNTPWPPNSARPASLF